MEKFKIYLLERKLEKIDDEVNDLHLWTKSIREEIKRKKEQANIIVDKLIKEKKENEK